jgi:membrane-associated phospholipid phosphatase
VFKKSLVPDGCRWCGSNALDDGVSDALRWSNTDLAHQISDVTGFYLAPALALGLVWASSGRPTMRWADDAIPIAESAIATGLFHHLIKFIAGRQRPFVHHADPGRPPELDDNMSFFSGHTATAFALATSAGMVAHYRGYKLEPVIWGAGLAVAATTGYLRMAADKHWFTDVLTGAVVGSAFGVAMPWLERRSLEAMPTGNGLVVAGTF